MKRHGKFSRLSCRMYAALLYLYPAAFSRRYQEQMIVAFKDDLDQTLREGRWRNKIMFPIQIARDSLASLLRERIAALDVVGIICFLAAVGVGLCAAYVDHHNATEVYPTLGVALLGSFVLGLIRPTHPWRWALMVAPWVAFIGSSSSWRETITSPGRWAILGVVLIPSLIGAGAGSLLRRCIQSLAKAT